LSAATVSQNNLMQRLNRALAHDGEFLRKTNPKRVAKLGSYFVADIASDLIVRQNVNLEDLAREKGVLAGWETVEVTYEAKERNRPIGRQRPRLGPTLQSV
jgi:hypothetical protein